MFLGAQPDLLCSLGSALLLLLRLWLGPDLLLLRLGWAALLLSNLFSTRSRTAVSACFWRDDTSSFLAASRAEASDPFSPARRHVAEPHMGGPEA